MREIKFRAWYDGLMYVVQSLHMHEDGTSSVDCINESEHALYHGSDIGLMQFTGLQDRQGKDIYEGDIIQRSHVGIPMIVRWNEKNACFDLTMRDLKDFDSTTIWYTQFASRDYEVLGNIYETPELLEVK